MTPPEPLEPVALLSKKLRVNVTAEREMGLRATLRRNKERLFDTLDAPVSRPRGGLPYALGALLATGLAGLVWLHGRPVLRAEPHTVTTSLDVAQPEGPASFARKRSQVGERIALDDGTLAFRTHGTGAKLRVVVPDGELEDVGTAFRVTVGGGRTASIEVSEGLVVFHRHGAEDIRLPAGSAWHAPPAPSAGYTEAEPPPPALAGPDVRPQPVASKPRPAAPAAPAALADTGEDAAYLRIVALIREKRRDEARVASQEYLRRYPNGFRRVEVEPLAR